MTSDRWTNFFFKLALSAGRLSKDPSVGVGAVIVDDNNRIITTGFNGLPSGIDFNEVITPDRETRLQCTIHAEENALAFAWRDVKGMTLFSSRQPCARCAAMIVQRGISCVAYLVDPNDTINPSWANSFELADEIFRQAGTDVYEFERKEEGGDEPYFAERVSPNARYPFGDMKVVDFDAATKRLNQTLGSLDDNCPF